MNLLLGFSTEGEFLLMVLIITILLHGIELFKRERSVVDSVDQVGDNQGASRSITIHGEQVVHYRWRTHYLPVLFDQICAHPMVAKKICVIDLGCSTGKNSKTPCEAS